MESLVGVLVTLILAAGIVFLTIRGFRREAAALKNGSCCGSGSCSCGGDCGGNCGGECPGGENNFEKRGAGSPDRLSNK